MNITERLTKIIDEVMGHKLPKETKLETLTLLHWDKKFDYTIADTKERGRILFTHTCKAGEFGIGVDLVKTLYSDYNCDHTVTCYPAMQYKIHPKEAKELNILYKGVNAQIISDIGIKGKLIILKAC
jgi:hypothetical protein